MPFSVPGFSPGYHIACCVLSPRCPLTVAFTVWKVAGDPCAPVRTRCVIPQTNQERFTCSLCGFAQVNRRAWGPQRPPILSIATEEDREAGQCLGNGQAFFVFLHKRIEGTSDVIWGKRFWDREKEPTPESWEDTQALLQCLPTQQGSKLWLTHNLSITKTKQLPDLSLKKCPWHTCRTFQMEANLCLMG